MPVPPTLCGCSASLSNGRSLTTVSGYTLGPRLRSLARELAGVYAAGQLVIVAGAGVSRAAGLPGWDDLIASIQSAAADDLGRHIDLRDVDAALTRLHRTDPISRADSLKRLLTTPVFNRRLHEALYGGLAPDDRFSPSISHWHIASLAGRPLMPEVFTSNYDDLLEDAKTSLGRSGRVRHFHGRLPQKWSKATRLADPPVVTSRDYLAAEEGKRYDRVAAALREKTALLIGISLADPNLVRVVRSHANDCRAILVATRGALTDEQQTLRLDLLRRYWQGLNVSVTAVEAYEEVPAFLRELRHEVAELEGRSQREFEVRALAATARYEPQSWSGAREWRTALRDAVAAAKSVAQGVRGDASLSAGFYAITADGHLEHLVGSTTKRDTYHAWPRRRLLADDARPWGAAGYCYAAGVAIASSSAGAAFDRNVPDASLIEWQRQRADQGRLPASAVLCIPAWVRFERALANIGVLYFSSHRSWAFENREEAEALRAVLQLTLATMIQTESIAEVGPS